MIHEEICTYEVAKLAKEKGFPQQYDSLTHIYGGKDSFNVGVDLKYKKSEGTLFEIIDWNPYLNDIAAPTQSLLQRWLREEKFIDFEIYPIFINGVKVYTCYVYASNLNKPKKRNYFDTYELALEDALKYSLENLI